MESEVLTSLGEPIEEAFVLRLGKAGYVFHYEKTDVALGDKLLDDRAVVEKELPARVIVVLVYIGTGKSLARWTSDNPHG